MLILCAFNKYDKYIIMNKILLLLITLILAISGNIYPQKKEREKKDVPVDSLFNENSKTWVAIPIINNNPTMKTGFGANAMYLFKLKKKDKLSPPSSIGLTGFYTTNNSYVIIPRASFYWSENKNRMFVGAGSVAISHRHSYSDESLNCTDITLVYKESWMFFWVEYDRKIIGNWFLGGSFSGSKVNYSFDQGSDEENAFTEEFFKQKGITDKFMANVGLKLSFDNRDYIYYPTKGYQVVVNPRFYQKWLGSDNNYVNTVVKFIGYFSLRSNMVLASQLYGGFSSGDVPFAGYQNYGTRFNLRGYPGGKYRGKYMTTLQAELRWRFYKRFGAVIFAGTGSIWGDETEDVKFMERNWLPAAGLGARFMISREKKINIRLDYAVGVDGNSGIYFGMMEVF